MKSQYEKISILKLKVILYNPTFPFKILQKDVLAF